MRLVESPVVVVTSSLIECIDLFLYMCTICRSKSSDRVVFLAWRIAGFRAKFHSMIVFRESSGVSLLFVCFRSPSETPVATVYR